ncbi:lipid II flippase MurJ [Salana multivorans]
MTASPETPAEKTPDGSGGRGLGGAVAAMFSGTLVSRVLGFLRAAIIGVALGVAGGATDAFALANNLPNTIYMLIAGGVINAVLVPQLVRAAKDPDGGRSYTNRLLTVGGVGLLAITAILTVAAPLLILMYGSRLGSGWLPIAYAFAYWCIPQIFFYGLYTLLGQVLNAKSVFGPYMWAPVLNNVVALAGLFVYLRIFGAMPTPILSPADFGTDRILLLGVTATLGVALQALILVVPLWRSGFRYRPEWGLKGLRTAGTMGGWTFGALLVGQVGVLAISNVAAAASAQSDLDKIPYAGNYAYGLAFTVFMLPQSLVVVSLITAMFTRLSKHASDRDRSAVRAAMSLSVRSSGVFTMLATVAMVALALPLATLVTLGQQRESAVDQIAGLVVALALGIPGLALWSVVQRVYFAYQDARSPFWIQVPMMLIVVAGVVISRFATRPNGWVFGACLAMSLSYTVGGLVGYLGLRRRLVHLDGSRIFSTYFRLALAAGPALVAGFGTVVLLQHLLPGRGLLTAIVETGIGGAVVVGIYFGLAHVLKVKEIQIATMRLRGILTRLLRPVTGRLRTMGEGRGAAAENVTGESWVLDDAVTSGMLLADRFRVESGLSSTMTGVRAWRGRDTILERDVDILSVGGPRGEDILDGARRASLITDPRVPRVLRVGEHDRSGYIVLEPAPGTTLADLLAAGSLSEPAARSIVGEVASALEAARRRGVHHLALGPTFVAIDDDGGVHVTGLGVAAAASGRSLSPAESAQADADAAVALYPLLSGKPLPPEAERDLPTPSNVVVAFAPWSSVPPLEELLTYVTSAPRDEDENNDGASGPEDPDDGDDDGPIDGGAAEDGTDEAAGDEAGDAGADEPIETGQAEADDAEGTTATAEAEALDDEAVENEAVGEELVQEAVATGGAVLGAASDLSTPIVQDEGDEGDEGDEVADDETDTSAQGPAEATRPIETTTPIETAGSETAPTKTDDSGTSGSEELGSDETGSGEPASGATAPGVTGATAVSTGLGAVRKLPAPPRRDHPVRARRRCPAGPGEPRGSGRPGRRFLRRDRRDLSGAGGSRAHHRAAPGNRARDDRGARTPRRGVRTPRRGVRTPGRGIRTPGRGIRTDRVLCLLVIQGVRRVPPDERRTGEHRAARLDDAERHLDEDPRDTRTGTAGPCARSRLLAGPCPREASRRRRGSATWSTPRATVPTPPRTTSASRPARPTASRQPAMSPVPPWVPWAPGGRAVASSSRRPARNGAPRQRRGPRLRRPRGPKRPRQLRPRLKQRQPRRLRSRSSACSPRRSTRPRRPWEPPKPPAAPAATRRSSSRPGSPGPRSPPPPTPFRSGPRSCDRPPARPRPGRPQVRPLRTPPSRSRTRLRATPSGTSCPTSVRGRGARSTPPRSSSGSCWSVCSTSRTSRSTRSSLRCARASCPTSTRNRPCRPHRSTRRVSRPTAARHPRRASRPRSRRPTPRATAPPTFPTSRECPRSEPRSPTSPRPAVVPPPSLEESSHHGRAHRHHGT